LWHRPALEQFCGDHQRRRGPDRLQQRLPNDLGQIGGALEPHREDLAGVVIESTYNWYWLVDGLVGDRLPRCCDRVAGSGHSMNRFGRDGFCVLSGVLLHEIGEPLCHNSANLCTDVGSNRAADGGSYKEVNRRLPGERKRQQYPQRHTGARRSSFRRTFIDADPDAGFRREVTCGGACSASQRKMAPSPAVEADTARWHRPC
jgi:hypothetical protein